MTTLNLNQFSPFLVISNLAKIDGAEKALRIKVIAALFPAKLHSFFSPLVLIGTQSLSTPFPKSKINAQFKEKGEKGGEME